jgi:hypothetical protein
VLAAGRLPMPARYLAAPDREFDVDTLIEFGLRSLLDGPAPLIAEP